MSGGSLSVNAAEYLGNNGTGPFIQSGGTHNIGNSLFLGYNAGSSGTYNLSGGGLLSAAQNEYVGYSGTGTFTQSGGINNSSEGSLTSAATPAVAARTTSAAAACCSV